MDGWGRDRGMERVRRKRLPHLIYTQLSIITNEVFCYCVLYSYTAYFFSLKTCRGMKESLVSMVSSMVLHTKSVFGQSAERKGLLMHLLVPKLVSFTLFVRYTFECTNLINFNDCNLYYFCSGTCRQMTTLCCS